MPTQTATSTANFPAATTSAACSVQSRSGITLTEVKAHLRVSSNAAISNEYLLILLNNALDFVEDYCGFRFGEDTVSEYVTPSHKSGVLRVSRLPIVSVTSIVDAYNESTVDADNYRINTDKTGVNPVENYTWDVSRDRYLVTYTGGYGRTVTVPHGIRVAVLSLVGRWYEVRDTAKSMGFQGSLSKSFFDFHASDVIRILDCYKLGALAYFA